MIVGFSGLAGSGKSKVATPALEALGFTRVGFADPLRRMLLALGLTEAEMADKERPCEKLCGKTPRQALQALGTEWGRERIGDDFWVRLWARAASRHPDVVVDDVRFANEAAAIRAAGGLIIRIERTGAGSASGGGHVSEHGGIPADVTLQNDGSPADLSASVVATITARRSPAP